MNLTSSESGEPREFVNHREIVAIVLDGVAQLAVLLAAVLVGSGDDIRVYVNPLEVGKPRFDVFAALIKPSLDVLILGANAGVDDG